MFEQSLNIEQSLNKSALILARSHFRSLHLYIALALSTYVGLAQAPPRGCESTKPRSTAGCYAVAPGESAAEAGGGVPHLADPTRIGRAPP